MSLPSTINAKSPTAYLRLGDAPGTTAPVDQVGSISWAATSVTFGTAGLVSGDADTAATVSASDLIGTLSAPSWTKLSAWALFKPASVNGHQSLLSAGKWLWQIRGTVTGGVWTGTMVFFPDTDSFFVESASFSFNIGDIVDFGFSVDNATGIAAQYVNGAALGVGSSAAGNLSNGANLTIGKWVGVGEPYSGVADEFAIFGNQALSAGDMLAFHNAATGAGADTTPPVVASASVNTAGTTLTINFTEAGSPPVLPASGVTGFTLTASGGAVSLGSTAISGTTYTATTSRTIGAGETLALAYAPGNVTDSAGSPNSLASFSGTSVTNNSTADVTAPTLSARAIGTAGTTLVLTASEAITAGAGGNAGLTLSATNGAVTATYASGTGSTSITYNLNRTIGHGETVTLTYVQPGNGWEDGAGNDLASFSGAAVTNGSNLPAAPTSLAVASVTASSVGLTWTDNADNETAFVVEYDTVNTFDQGPTDVTLNTGDVQSDSVLTLAASTTYYFRVKATNGNGSSDWSNVVSGTTSAAVAPTGGASRTTRIRRARARMAVAALARRRGR